MDVFFIAESKKKKMSSKVTGNGAVDIPSEVVIVDSQVIIKLANVLGASCPVASVYLQEFTDARW